MFSIITMASSTTKPDAMVSAISDRLSRLKPHSAMMPKVPISDSGRAAAGITVAHALRRNRKITSTTSPAVSTSVFCTSTTEARMVSVRSVSTAMWICGGRLAWSDGSSLRMRSTVSMMLAPGWRCTFSRTAGLPSCHAARRVFSTESTTVPMSVSRTGPPFL